MTTHLNLESLLDFSRIQSKKVVAHDHFSVNLISLEKGSKLAAHVSPQDAVVVVLSGQIRFLIEGKAHTLKAQDLISFQKDEVHEVEAAEDSRFILIR